jgi:CheY-like chemotaxis protein
MKAAWCLCAASQRTLVCSHCQRCFCTAPDAVKSAFWDLASAALVSRRWQAGKPAAPTPLDAAHRHGPVILVVDDSKVIHALVDAILSNFEGSIVHAHDGSEGFRMARLIHPDILLTDALLPGLDGRDVVRLLKSDPTTADIRTIIMTALYKGQRYRAEAFREFRCDAYIEKPVSAAHLRAVIDQMLGKTAAQALAS